MSMVADDDFPWENIFDAHCHPTDTLTKLRDIPSMRAQVLLVMATRAQDQSLVADAAQRYGLTLEELDRSDARVQHRIIPAFGWHPWFSYQMFFQSDYDGATDLTAEQKSAHYQQVLSPTPSREDDDIIQSMPNPKPFEVFLTALEAYVVSYPLALLGEVGLDKSFRLPTAWAEEDLEQRNSALTPGGREGRRLTTYRVDMNHQRRVLLTQLAVAGKLKRAASIHGVQAHGILHDTMASLWKGFERPSMSKRQQKKMQSSSADAQTTGDVPAKDLPFPPRICLHSYSGPAEAVKQYTASRVPCEVYFSFSVTINTWSDDCNGKVEAAVRAVPDDRILMESDLHTAGQDMDRCLKEVACKICQIKGWEIRPGTAQLARNWKRFVFGREAEQT